MPITSVSDDLLNGTVTAVGNLGFTSPTSGQSVPVVKRKLPMKLQTIDPPVQIVVSRSDAPEGFKYIAFGQRSKEYLVLVAIVSPNNADQVSNLPLYQQWRQQIEDLYNPLGGFASPAAIQTLAGSSQCWDIRVKPGVFLDRRMISKNYDYQVVGVGFKALG